MKLEGLKSFVNKINTEKLNAKQVKTDVPQNTDPTVKVNNFNFNGQIIRAKFFRTEVPAETSTPQTLTATEQQEIDAGIGTVLQSSNNGMGPASIELANQLRGKSPEYQAEFLRQMAENAPDFTRELLAIAGGLPPHGASEARPNEDDSRVIAQALGNAYDSGTLSEDFIQQLLDPNRLSSGFNAKYAHYIGNLVSQSGSREMMEAFFNEAMRIFNEGDSEDAPYYISAAANALAGDPELLQTKLAEMNANGTLEEFLANLDPKVFSDASSVLPDFPTAYANLVEAAAKIQPPTPEVADLFRITAEKYMDRPGMAEAMTTLYTGGYNEAQPGPNGKIDGYIYHSNAEFFMLELSKYGEQGDGSSADSTDILALSNFYAATAFNDEFPDSQLVADITARETQKLQYAIENYPNGMDSRTRELIEGSVYINPNSNESPEYQVQQQLAFRLGRISGGVFQGFEIAVQNRNADNKAIDNLVDMAFSFIPTSKITTAIKKIPGINPSAVDKLPSSQILNFGKQALKDWLHKQDLNENREEIFTELLDITGSQFTPDLYDDYANGYGEVGDIVRSLTNK